MILYHGSNTSFDEIDLTKSLTNKDFGTEKAINKLRKL